MATSNAVTIKAGTYVAVSDFASADVADLSIFGINFSLMFISNGTTFDGINIQTSAMGIPYLYYGSTLTFSTSWQNEAYKTVVLETDQGTSNDFADWFTACFTLQEQPTTTDSVTITYGDRTITLTAGQKCTFKGGKVMQSDIVATVSASEEVTLGDITITVNSFSTLTFTHKTSSGDTVESKTASSGTVSFSDIASGSYIAITGTINAFSFGNDVNCVGNASDRTITDIGENAAISVNNAD